MIHQCDALEACLGGGAGHRRQPARRVAAPQEAGDLQHEAKLSGPLQLIVAGLPGARAVRGLDPGTGAGASLAGVHHDVPALGGDLRGDRPHPP